MLKLIFKRFDHLQLYHKLYLENNFKLASNHSANIYYITRQTNKNRLYLVEHNNIQKALNLPHRL